MAGDLAGLGRLAKADPRDSAFRLMVPQPRKLPTRRTWYSRGVLDQGGTSQCVAYSGVKYLTTSPVLNKPPFTPAELYVECQRNDEWPGEEPDYEGTSVRALFKVLKRHGYIGEYRWTWKAEDVATHILLTGPMVLGTLWTRDMFMPDRAGFITPTGRSAGGHAYLAIGADLSKRCPDGSRGAITILNSWGAGWGANGRAHMSLKDLQTLLADDGEACVATEILRAA